MHPRSTPCCFQQTHGLAPNNLECSFKVLWQLLSHAWICTYDTYNILYIIIHISLLFFNYSQIVHTYIRQQGNETLLQCSSSMVCRFQWILKPQACQSFQKAICSVKNIITKVFLWSVCRNVDFMLWLWHPNRPRSLDLFASFSATRLPRRPLWPCSRSLREFSNQSADKDIKDSKTWMCDKIPPIHDCWFADWWFSPF